MATNLKKPSEYSHSAKALIMESGNVFVNYHGFCLFLDPKYKYVPWIVTKKNGMLPPTVEYGRLRKLCKEFVLSNTQELLVWGEIQKLLYNPFHGLTPEELETARNGKRAKEEARRAETYGTTVVASKVLTSFKSNHSVAECKKNVIPGNGQRARSFDQLSKLLAQD